MLQSNTAARPMSASRKSPPAVADPVGRFLVESERRVIVHCQKLLRAPNLPVEDQRHLERLLAEAEGRLQELTSIQN